MKKLFKNKLQAGIAVGLAGVAVVVSIGFMKTTSNETPVVVVKKKVEAPIKNVDVEYKNYSVDARKGLKIKYFETGSVITIPDSAFVDGEGKIVMGKVDIKYREFHDVADIFLSGIPMTYDSAGEQYHFESAGMLELLAFQYGKPVFMNPDKRIIVNMASQQPEDTYNIYKYNPLQGNWNYVYKDKAIPVKEGEINNDDKKVADIRSKALMMKNDLIAPLKSDESKYHFDVAIDSAEFPELSVYKGVSFEVDPKEKDFNPLYASTTWNDIALERGKRTGSYRMTLIKETEDHTFETVPVLEGKKYDEALEVYKGQLKVRRAMESRQQRSRDSLFIMADRERMDQNQIAKDRQYRQSGSIETQSLVVRVFVISGFGIWNSDCPSSLPKGEQFAATFTDTLGKKLDFKVVYLVEKGRNAMFAIYAGTKISFNPEKNNCLWAVTNDNKLAVFGEDKFKDLKIKNDSSAVEMTVIDKKISKPFQVRSILKI